MPGGAWFGSQFGSTAWIGILGLVLLSRDALAGCAVLLVCLALNGVGLALWRSRPELDTLRGIQRFLWACVLAYALVVAIVHARGLATPLSEAGPFSTVLPLWIVLVPLVVLFVIRARARAEAHGD